MPLKQISFAHTNSICRLRLDDMKRTQSHRTPGLSSFGRFRKTEFLGTRNLCRQKTTDPLVVSKPVRKPFKKCHSNSDPAGKSLAVPVRLSAGDVLRFYHARLDSEDSLSPVRRWKGPKPSHFRLSPEIQRETMIRIRLLGRSFLRKD